VDHVVCLNTLSLPANDKESAYNLMLEACNGMLELNTGNDRFALYFDDNDQILSHCLLAENYTYSDFLDELEANQSIDLLMTLVEAEDKSPALDYLSDDEFNELASFQFYLPNTGYNNAADILGIAWLVNGVLLSLRTHDRWGRTKIEIARWNNTEHREDRYPINNISGEQNGVDIRNEIISSSELTLDGICQQCTYTEEFRKWYDSMDKDNQRLILKKIQLASQRNFLGGEPLFKTLENGNGMRELRLSAYPGGAIRILFGDLPDYRKAILIGFIKKRNTEGYVENIPRAISLWENILNSI
jgi:hypothetical protein